MASKAKRMRYDSDGSVKDPHKPPPSLVVHVRGLHETIVESDLIEAVKGFGKLSYVVMMPRKRQALVEFADMNGSSSCVQHAQQNTILVGGHPAFFNYSLSKKIQRPEGQDGEARNENHILLFTILNPTYPVTVDVLKTICTPSGEVLRIVIFKKNGVQAMVEFDSVDSARRAKQSLNGADIYSGCCTLKIEYAKPTRLNVFRNDGDSWDFSNPTLGRDDGRRQPLLQDPMYAQNNTKPLPYGYGEEGYEQYNDGVGVSGNGSIAAGGGNGGGSSSSSGGGGGRGGNYDAYADSGYRGSWPESRGGGGGGQAHAQGGPGGQSYSRGGSYSSQPGAGSPQEDYNNGHGGPGPSPGNQNCVVMVYGLDTDTVNPDRLFNLLCLYGNVVRIKFLMSKEGSAMVQLGDSASVSRVINNLSNVQSFGKRLQFAVSKQAYLQEVHKPRSLPDGTPSFKDYSGSRNNRYMNPEAASKNRILPPCKTLHYFNAPPKMNEVDIRDLFARCGAHPPDEVVIFPSKKMGFTGEKSSSGLVQWNNKTDAVEALMLVNHAEVENPDVYSDGKYPFIFKLCFSMNPISDERHGKE